MWQLPLGPRIASDILVVGRLRAPDRSILDYFIVPAYSQIHGGVRTHLNDTVPYLELYHHRTLDPLIEAFRRCPI
jgi:hypothetical protein